ncbi:hypothetical protein ACFPM1_00325 [Halorubrum rubrum]|uniref:SRPBCC family protein n=1 Tax=Halorubrum rubrum TaxID=1126240 RepID=A0ABD5QWZ0_9EURY|nr:hypothetical protein [Halorubrum rubrum]
MIVNYAHATFDRRIHGSSPPAPISTATAPFDPGLMPGINLWEVVRVPFDAVVKGYRQLRKALFTASRPSGEYFVVDRTVPELERDLGGFSFAPNWEFSYYTRGEVLNLARVVYERDSAEGTTYRWWQTHLRGWRDDEGRIELHAHWELEPTENGNPHLDGVGYDPDRGMERLESFLEKADIEYESRTIETGSDGH